MKTCSPFLIWCALIAAIHAGIPAVAANRNQIPLGVKSVNLTDAAVAPYSVSSGIFSACDVNLDGSVNIIDVQLAINQCLGITPCTSADVDGNGLCNVTDVQRVINAALGGSCDSVPSNYQDVYSSLTGYLDSFNATLSAQWNGSKYPVLFTAQLLGANANAGPQLINSNQLAAVQMDLQMMKAMGVQAVLVEVGFPMLYQPFFSSQSEFQQYVNFYSQVAASVRALGLKLIVENQNLLSNDAQAGWNVAPFYATLNWTQYQQGRAQTALVIAQTLKPDYMVLLEEPDTEAAMSGQTEANTVSGATSMLNLILTSVRQSGVAGLKVGAGVGLWHPQYLQFTQSFVTMPLDFIDMHTFPVNHNYLLNALTMASTAAAAGKPVTMAQSWLWKVRDTELNVLTADQIRARDPYSFWAPLDAYFVQTMENLANYTQMRFQVPFDTQYFSAYLPYSISLESLTPGQVITQEMQQASQNVQQAVYTSTGLSYYKTLVSPADTTPPSTPANLTGVSGNPTSTSISWSASTDNVGVAGYYLFRNDVKIASTAATQYQDTGLTGATTYSYVVKAFDVGGNVSLPSLTGYVSTRDVIPPTAPTNLVATAVSSQEVTLTWTASTDNTAVNSYRVFRGTSATALSQVASLYGTTTSHTDYGLAASTKYYYGVEAMDTSGNISAMSATVSATTPP